MAKLRHLGMMRSNVANSKRHRENMTRAVEQLLEKIDQTKGQPFDIRLPLSFSVANIFTSTVISKTFDFNDPELLREVVELDDSFEIIENVTIANFLPIFCYWPTFRRILKTIRRRREATRNFYRKIIAEHRIDLDPENPRDFIDAYLIKMDKDKEEGKQTYFQGKTTNQVPVKTRY